MIDQLPVIPAITALCYFSAELYKSFAPDRLYRHIPVFCGLVGILIGVFCCLLLPGFLLAENPVVAAAIGMVSGLAATGVNQSVKQINQKE